MRIEPRWLDAVAAAEYISARVDQMTRLAKQGRIPQPSYHLGPKQPRWDRLALDSAFQGGAASTNAEQAMSAVAQEILQGR